MTSGYTAAEEARGSLREPIGQYTGRPTVLIQLGLNEYEVVVVQSEGYTALVVPGAIGSDELVSVLVVPAWSGSSGLVCVHVQ